MLIIELTEDRFVPHQFLKRLGDIMQLVHRGATPGERQSAQAALQRFQHRAEQEKRTMSPEARAAFERQIEAVLRGEAPMFATYDREPPKPKTRWKVGQSVVHNQSGAETDGEIGQITEIRTGGVDPEYRLHWISLPNKFTADDELVTTWVSERHLRDLEVADVERIRSRNKLGETALVEKAIRIDADGHPITVIANPTVQQVLTLLDRSPDEEVKGLIIGDDLYFWSATAFATHGHVAQKLWPTDGQRNHWEYPEYIEGRLIIQNDRGHPTIDFDESLLTNPRILALLKSDRIYFHFPGAGFMNYSEYLENERDNEERRRARLARMSAP